MMRDFGSVRVWQLAMVTLVGMAPVSSVIALNTDLVVCLAYDNRSDQRKCCEELGIDPASCNKSGNGDIKGREPNAKDRRNAGGYAFDNAYFYCKYRNLDGTGGDWARWSKGGDFKYIPGRRVWEWRTKYTVQTISENGTYNQRALVPSFSDQVGRCDKSAEKEYKKKLEAIKRMYGQ